MTPVQATAVTPEAGRRDGVTAYLFDERHGEEATAWEDAFSSLGDGDLLLWIDLGDPRSETVVIDCAVGPNWIFTAHNGGVAALDDFRAVADGEGAIGSLDAPSFLAALLEWVVTSYLRAFDEIEAELEDFDVDALTRPTGDPERHIGTLVAARRRVGHLRRALAPHREIFAALSHSEFDSISTEGSSARFAELAARVDTVLATARDVKDGIASSFDVLIVRTEHRTSEIIKILTIASILLLPGALLAGIAGMNVNFKPEVFLDSGLFWMVAATIVAIAAVTFGLARQRRWF
jgi:magnesium transporter